MKVAYENDKQPNEISLTKFSPNYDSITKENYEPSESPEVKGKYPKIVFLIIINEFCERYILFDSFDFLLFLLLSLFKIFLLWNPYCFIHFFN